MTVILICLLTGYFIGCLSPSYIIGLRRGYDVRRSGSGNAGASNTVIMAGKKAGLFVAVFDILKAAAACKLCNILFPVFGYAGAIAGIACIFGHMFPVFLGFHGGKGLACLGGVILAHGMRSFLLMLLVFLMLAFLINYIAVSAVSLAAVWPAYFAFSTGDKLGALILALPFLPMLAKHMENFRRIKAGKELHFSFLWDKERELARISQNG